MRMVHAHKLSVGGTVVAVMALASSGASALDEVAEARETYREGLALEAAGDWAGALVKFRQVAARRPTPQVRFHIARCQEHLGRLTEALGTYRLTLGEAEAARADDVLREAEQARVALEARLPRLTVERGEGAEADVVALDGVDLGEASLGLAMLLDPGPHRVELKRRRNERLEVIGRWVVTLAEGERRTLRVSPSGAPIEGAPGGSAQGAPAPAAPGAQAPGVVQPATVRVAPPSRLPAYGLAALGAGLGVASVVFWTKRADTLNELDQRCVGGRCPASMEPVAGRGQRYSVVAVGTGAAALGALGAAVWLLVRESPSAPTQGARSAPRLAVGGSFVRGPTFSLEGSF